MSTATPSLQARTSSFVPFSRLIRLELRKVVNTRSGFWLVTGMLLVCVILTTAMLTTGGAEHLSFMNMFGMLNQPMSFLPPVLAILLVTSEWSQRTALVTFALEPRRGRVVAAKLATSVVMTLAVVAVTAAFATIATWLAVTFRSDVPGWEMSGDVLRNVLLLQLAHLLEGFGFAMLILNSAATIVVFFVLPNGWTLIGSLVPWVHTHVLPWTDFNTAQDPFQNGEAPFQSAVAVTGEQWGHLVVAALIWVALPLTLGIWRTLRSEVK